MRSFNDFIGALFTVGLNAELPQQLPVPRGGFIKSMLLGDQDVLTEDMVITSSTREPLRIVISTRGGVVSTSKCALSFSPVSASSGEWDGASEATTLMV